MTMAAGPGSGSFLNPGALRPGSGSGFLWDTHGHIVTNFHVVQRAGQVTVTLSDQQARDAVIIGSDPSNDVAVLRLPEAPLDVAPIRVGTSHDLMVGQRVFAIGNPFGLDQTLTGGAADGPGVSRTWGLEASSRLALQMIIS
jgi:S1-C subfamily serine protease